nr:uncharacterized protein LOC127329311 [Lolium perenne]
MLRAAGLVRSPWPRLALEEPHMWRHIELPQGDLWDWQEPPSAGWKAMALAAVELSAGRCESFIGHVDVDVLVHLADRAPLLRKLYVTGWPYIEDKKLITTIIKKLPLLEHLVLSDGIFEEELLLALLDHCPRLELLDLTEADPMFRVWEEPINTMIQNCSIKDL